MGSENVELWFVVVVAALILVTARFTDRLRARRPPTDRGVGDGVPRSYSTDSAAGREKTSFGGSQGGD